MTNLLGGEIVLNSTEGKGTKVSFSIKEKEGAYNEETKQFPYHRHSNSTPLRYDNLKMRYVTHKLEKVNRSSSEEENVNILEEWSPLPPLCFSANLWNLLNLSTSRGKLV